MSALIRIVYYDLISHKNIITRHVHAKGTVRDHSIYAKRCARVNQLERLSATCGVARESRVVGEGRELLGVCKIHCLVATTGFERHDIFQTGSIGEKFGRERELFLVVDGLVSCALQVFRAHLSPRAVKVADFVLMIDSFREIGK